MRHRPVLPSGDGEQRRQAFIQPGAVRDLDQLGLRDARHELLGGGLLLAAERRSATSRAGRLSARSRNLKRSSVAGAPGQSGSRVASSVTRPSLAAPATVAAGAWASAA